MKFVVTRLSQLPADYATTPPCEGATQEVVKMIQSIPVKDLKNWRFSQAVGKFDPIGEAIWFNIGTNHRVEDGIARRDFDGVNLWTIDLDASGILAFLDQYKHVSIKSGAKTVHGMPEILIIDGDFDPFA